MPDLWPLSQSPDDVIIGVLVGYEAVAAVSQEVRWVPSLPLISTVVRARAKWQRWLVVLGLAATLVVHFGLWPV